MRKVRRESAEQAKRRIYIGFNVVGRDIGGVVDEGRKRFGRAASIAARVYRLWGAAFENMGTGERGCLRVALDHALAWCSFCLLRRPINLAAVCC